MDKEKLKTETMKWGKRAIFVVAPMTVATVLLAISTYKAIKGIDKSDWDNLKL